MIDVIDTKSAEQIILDIERILTKVVLIRPVLKNYINTEKVDSGQYKPFDLYKMVFKPCNQKELFEAINLWLKLTPYEHLISFEGISYDYTSESVLLYFFTLVR